MLFLFPYLLTVEGCCFSPQVPLWTEWTQGVVTNPDLLSVITTETQWLDVCSLRLAGAATDSGVMTWFPWITLKIICLLSLSQRVRAVSNECCSLSSQWVRPDPQRLSNKPPSAIAAPAHTRAPPRHADRALWWPQHTVWEAVRSPHYVWKGISLCASTYSDVMENKLD